jgi:hypothetical protein
MRDPQHDQSQWSGSAGLVVFALAIAAIPFFGALAYVTKQIGPASIPIWAIAAWGGAMIFRGPIGHAIGRNIGGQVQQGPAEVPAELYAELDELRARVGELEERVDFSERLLTKGQDEQQQR